MKYEFKYDIGDTVYLITDQEQKQRIVTAIIIKPGGTSYYLSCAEITTEHYSFEISTHRDLIKATGQ